MAEFSREKHRSLVLLNDGLHGHLLLCPETVDAVLDFRSHIDIPEAIIQVVGLPLIKGSSLLNMAIFFRCAEHFLDI